MVSWGGGGVLWCGMVWLFVVLVWFCGELCGVMGCGVVSWCGMLWCWSGVVGGVVCDALCCLDGLQRCVVKKCC